MCKQITNPIISPLSVAFKNNKGKRFLIQKTLAELNFYNGKIDGIYGPKTESAIKDYAKSIGKEDHLKSEKLAIELLQTLLSSVDQPKTVEKVEPEKKEGETEEKKPKKGLF